jgi:hypothetical protein
MPTRQETADPRISQAEDPAFSWYALADDPKRYAEHAELFGIDVSSPIEPWHPEHVIRCKLQRIWRGPLGGKRA